MEGTQSIEPPDPLRDRFRGALVGLAVGDALGAPLEFQPARSPENYVVDMIGGGWLKLEPGAYTDDTQMTLCTVESLLTKRVFDPDDIARRFVVWMQSSPPDIGSHTRAVLTAIAGGKPWEAASRAAQEENPNNAPNGSLMRCAPLAMFFYRHPDYAATLSPVLSRITHTHPDCEWSCVFVNVAVALLLAGRDRQEAIYAAGDACEEASEGVLERVRRAMQPQNTTSPTGYVLDTLEVAVWCFLHTQSFEAAVVAAVNRGEDADTVGAVVGALAGAHYGLSGIPERWLAPLQNRDGLIADSDRLMELARSS